jgi:peptidoglycan/xylan/chitin deacetylase (PgdA/CDA1 family)
MLKKRGLFLYEQGRAYYYAVRRGIAHWKNATIDTAPKLLILAYHRVLPDAGLDPLRIVVTLKTFIKQLDNLAMKYPVISLNDAPGQYSRHKGNAKIQIALTFDDGYWDNYEIVFPILKKMGLPASFFLTTDYVDGKARFADKRLIDGRTGREHNHINDRFISWQEARAMSNAGMAIGSHGTSHHSLADMPFQEAREEIKRSKEIIEGNIKRACSHFAFPFGSAKDYNEQLVDLVAKAGYRSCLLNIHGYNHFENDNFYLKRIIMEESTNVAHILG